MSKHAVKQSGISKSLTSDSPRTFRDFPFIVALGIFVISTLIFFWDVLMGNSFFWEDIVRFVYPLQSFAAKSWASGEIPFWNPFTFAGMPFLADLQVGFFYPLNRLLGLFLMPDGNISFSALQVLIIVHFLISQINTYFLSRSLKVSSIGSVISAIGYSFSLMMVCHSIHPMIVQHLAWFPLVLMFFIKGVNDSDIKSGILSGLIYGMSMLSGHTQMALYEGLVLFFVFVWYLFVGIKDGGQKGLRTAFPIISAALTIAIAAGIFMIQFMPTNELVKHSKRSNSTYEFVTEGSLQMQQSLTAFVPKLFGNRNGDNDTTVPYHLKDAPGHYYWETSFYFGISILALGLFGFIAGIKRREMQLMLGLSIFAFLFALGSNGFMFDFFYNLPFFGLFRNPVRMMFITILGFSLAAGVGFDALFGQEDKSLSKKLYIAFGSILGIALLGAFGAFTHIVETPEEFQSAVNQYGLLASLFALLTMFIALTANKLKYNSIIAGVGLIFVVFIDLYLAGADFNKTSAEPMTNYTSLFTNAPQMRDTLTPNFPNNVFRVKMRLNNDKGQTIAKPMEDNQGMLDNILLIEGYNPLYLNRMIVPIAPYSRILDMKNVRYSLEIDSAAGQLAFVNKPNAMGNAWFVYKANVIPTETLSKASVNSDMSIMSKYDFRNEVVVEEQPQISLSGDIADSVNHSVKLEKYENNYIKYSATTAQNAILCFSETYYPEWKAYINGKEAKLYAANYGFRAVELPAGTHTVEMKYESAAYSYGKMISISTILASIALYFGLFFYEKRKNKA